MTKGQEVKRIGRFALYGSVGFGVGWVFGNAVSFGDVWFPRMVFPGAVGGASLGLALKGWKKAGLLAVAGAIGYVLGYMAMMMALFTFGEHCTESFLILLQGPFGVPSPEFPWD